MRKLAALSSLFVLLWIGCNGNEETKPPISTLSTGGGDGGSMAVGGMAGAGGVGGLPMGEGACGVCELTNDLLCDMQLGCVQCLDNTNCTQGSANICHLGECFECSVDADCAPTDVCHPESWECDVPCTGNADCAPAGKAMCDIPNGKCVDCLSNGDCAIEPANPICNLTTFTCEDCNSNADCTMDSPICILGSGDCEDCIFTSHCAPGQECINKNCVTL